MPLPPAPTPGAASEAVLKAPDGTVIKRFPALYSWQQPTSTAGLDSVEWVEMRDPQDPAGKIPIAVCLWVEDLGGYLDASQVGGQARTNGTSPGEIAMFTVFNPAAQTDPGDTYASTQLIPNRPLLLTVPTLQQLAPTTPDVTGPNLAVRLGRDKKPGEQNLVPLGYGYSSCPTCVPLPLGEGYSKTPINPVSQFRSEWEPDREVCRCGRRRDAKFCKA